MKLSKLYSNKPFHNITFITDKGGLNVITGDFKGQGNSHNLGKSKLGELLNFMLLKRYHNFFFYKEPQKRKFSEHEFYLEILLNNGKYLTIKRIVNAPTKIGFKLRDIPTKNYTDNNDFEVLSFDKAKTYLNKLLDFDFCKNNEGENYRRLINYSLRSQGDYNPKNNTIFQLSKFSNKNDKSSWRALIFNILGFDGRKLIEKYDLESKIKKGKEVIKAQEQDYDVKHQNKDLLIGKIQVVENDKIELVKELKNLNFYQQDKNIIQDLVGNIETEIAILNTELYNLEFDIKKLEEAIRNEFSFDLKKTKNLFEEVELFFPNQLSKSYEQLLIFNQKITQERNEQIRETLKTKKIKQREINIKLIELNSKKEQHRDLIQDTSLFRKYTEYQKQLIEIERNLARFENQLEIIDEIEQKRNRIEEELEKDLELVKKELKLIVDTTVKNDLYMSIRKTFSQIVKQILNETAIITIKPNSIYNINFKPEFPNSAKDEGNTYYKILCVAFDLAILINYRNKSHFRFVYHDDIISGDDNGVKNRFIDSIRKICIEYDIQYIFTVVKDNIPPSQDLSDNIILELHDKSDEGKLFKMSF
ncbi:MAG: DUF2326 domain-containing protein [Saprospiraceae bacterium]